MKRLQFSVWPPGIFQSLMEGILKGIPGVITYFDDVLVTRGSKAELSVHLQDVILWTLASRYREKMQVWHSAGQVSEVPYRCIWHASYNHQVEDILQWTTDAIKEGMLVVPGTVELLPLVPAS